MVAADTYKVDGHRHVRGRYEKDREIEFAD